MKRMKKAVICILLLSFLTNFVSCGQKTDESAEEIMREFSDAYGAGGVVYSPTVPEGERGFCDADFFVTLYEREEDGIADYAVLLLSHLDGAGECAVFLCRTENDALLAAEMCGNRLDFLRSAYGVDTSYADGAFLLRKRKTTVFCAMPDADRAKRIWERIL